MFVDGFVTLIAEIRKQMTEKMRDFDVIIESGRVLSMNTMPFEGPYYQML